MAWTAHYSPHGVELRFTGHVGAQDICDAQREAMLHSYDGPMRFNVFDYTDIEDVDLDTGDLIRIFDGRKDFARSPTPYALVVIGRQPALRDLVRLWQVLPHSTEVHSILVWDRDEARQWLHDNGYLN